MRRVMISIALAMILGTALSGLPYLVGGRSLASNTNSLIFAQGLPTVSINDVSMTEGGSGLANMTFEVTLTASGAHPFIGVTYATADGAPPAGATAPSDYTSTSGPLGFPAGRQLRDDHLGSN
jgi:hypothetical protein